ncbi:MAG: TetR/AcrR family transcriptional regulator [Myxococcota bacterium]
MTDKRREREAAFVRRGFVESAAHVFARKGFHGATMDEIARTAGYSPAAIYRYFSSKDELFHALVRQVAEAFLGQFEEEPPVALSFEDRLRWFLTRHFRLAEDHRDFFVAFMAQRVVFDWEIRSELGEQAYRFYLDFLDALAGLTRLGIEEGVLQDCDPHELAAALSGLMRGFNFQWLYDEDAPPLTSNVDRIVDLFLHGAARPEEETA